MSLDNDCFFPCNCTFKYYSVSQRTPQRRHGPFTYRNQEMVGSGEPEALQVNVISSPLSAVALKDFWGITMTGGTEGQRTEERVAIITLHQQYFATVFQCFEPSLLLCVYTEN